MQYNLVLCLVKALLARQLQKRYLEKKKKLFFAFVDLEKAFDQWEVVKLAMRKLVSMNG